MCDCLLIAWRRLALRCVCVCLCVCVLQTGRMVSARLRGSGGPGNLAAPPPSSGVAGVEDELAARHHDISPLFSARGLYVLTAGREEIGITRSMYLGVPHAAYTRTHSNGLVCPRAHLTVRSGEQERQEDKNRQKGRSTKLD